MLARADHSLPDDLWSRARRRFEVSGVVQGVGFRPFVYVTASELALSGFVMNTGSGVVVEVEGGSGAIKEFGFRLRADSPPLALIEGIVESDEATLGGTEFTIGASREGDSGSRTLASPDLATCSQCLQEMRDPRNRRHRHPFITCTNCGPRFTIIQDLPYDRAATTMAAFDMCEACRREYENPADRRFHAQPIACHDCGPVLTLVRKDAGPLGAGTSRGEDALRDARSVLVRGGILAVKGLGGYHLACDARNSVAVGELRRRKLRGNKPFAVMARDARVARDLAAMTDSEEELLAGIRRPIVLLRRADSETARQVAASVSPGSPCLGVMLPHTPLHSLLFGLDGDPAGPDALVMTSGNTSGEPIVTDDEEALEVLAPFVDAWLCHDRKIAVPCDDSVTRLVSRAPSQLASRIASHTDSDTESDPESDPESDLASGPGAGPGPAELPVRRSRGYAPLPIALPFEVGPTLAVGADLKNTCAVASGRYAWLSQHIGDMDHLSTLEALTRTERHLERLTGVRPEQLIVDQHPGYRSSGWARSQANGRAIRQVQHHHAHIASVMGEHGLGADERVIGFAFDGTGYGSDGAVWGGEVLLATYKCFRRAAHLSYVPLAGGDATVLRPYRMALAHLHAAGVPWKEDLPPVRACPVVEREVLAHQFATGLGCVPTSSMGRLFDSVASLAGVRQIVDYEAEAAVELEGLAGTWSAPSPISAYRFDIQHLSAEGPLLADPGPVIRSVAADVLAGMPVPQIARQFHDAVTRLIVDLAEACRNETGLGQVVLGGGVFQNALLVEAADRALSERGFTVLLPRMLPANDGGIALGQILIGAST